MIASVKAQVTPEMLRWAREQAGCDLEQAAKSAGTDTSTIAEWESSGTVHLPTVRQAQKLARAYRVSLAILYLEHPTPGLSWESVPEFRKLDPETGSIRSQSRQLRWMIRQAQERQAFAIELLEDDGESPQPWIGSVSLDEDPEVLGGRIREELGVNGDLPQSNNKERVLDWWVERVESLGAFVSQYRPDGNQHWSVEPSEARGLSLCHPIAPYIVLNSRDAPAGRIFTLMHELAHIYYGQCGVDDLGDERQIPVNVRILEHRCNQVAGASLMPPAMFMREWEKAVGSMMDKVSKVADVFGVSRQATVVRARSNGMQLISEEEYGSIIGYLTNEYREIRDSRLVGGGGGMAVPLRILKDFGGKYTRLVLSAHAEERLSRLEAADALDVRVSDIEGIRREGIRRRL